MSNRLGEAKNKTRVIAKQLGQDIKIRREHLGLGLREFGEKADVSYGYVIYLENGERNPTLEFLIRVAEGLECELVVGFVSK